MPIYLYFTQPMLGTQTYIRDIPIATQLPDVLFNDQGRIAAIAREKGIEGRELVQESENELYLEELLKTRRVFE